MEGKSESYQDLEEIQLGFDCARVNWIEFNLCHSSFLQVTLVAVSKTKPEQDILVAHLEGHRDFGENYVSPSLSFSSFSWAHLLTPFLIFW